MFENILGQPAAVQTLSQNLEAGEVPRSLLFYGEPYTGKLSTALELARVLTCEQGSAAWNCSCASCGLHRVLLHPGTIMMGPRYFMRDITAAGDVLKRHPKPIAQYLYLRAMRKLLRRLDPLLWEGNEQKLKKISDAYSSLEDNLELIHPARSLPEEKKLVKLLDENRNNAEKICASGLLDSVSIDNIRKVTYWAHTTSQGYNKIIILEHADRLLESARNAFLKILEEPPSGVYFILLTTNRQGVIDTILSRVRSLYFMQRTAETSGLVIEKIFRDNPENFKTLAQYFETWEDVNAEELNAIARRWLRLLLHEKDALAADRELENIITQLARKDLSSRFIVKFTEQLRLSLSGEADQVPLGTQERWLEIIRRGASRMEVFHQNPQLVFSSMFSEMKVQA
ncbi:MAG: DNA polymerase III [Spirochaetales bacterium]|nr:MAG: DNA polymerase III [Spirochaetales bacterium]